MQNNKFYPRKAVALHQRWQGLFGGLEECPSLPFVLRTPILFAGHDLGLLAVGGLLGWQRDWLGLEDKE